MEILSSTINPFKGIVVSPDKLPKDPECFIKSLDRSIKSWGDDEYLVVWLQVPLCKASLIPRAIDAGFQFHHAGDDYLMLTLQLSDGAYIPPFASHYAGAGGVVINDSGELLVVCERHRPNNRLPYYKLPGGTLKSGEDLVDAVVREVLEETGINTRFESLICMRQMHGYRHGKSDFYFVCRLTPLNTNIAMQTEEIEECMWMSVDSYMNSNLVSPFNKSIVLASMEVPGMVRTDFDGFGRPDQREFFMPGPQYGRPWIPQDHQREMVKKNKKNVQVHCRHCDHAFWPRKISPDRCNKCQKPYPLGVPASVPRGRYSKYERGDGC